MVRLGSNPQIDGVVVTVINTHKRRKKARHCIFRGLRKAGMKADAAKWLSQHLAQSLRCGQQFYGTLGWTVCGRRTQKYLRRYYEADY